MKKRLLTVGFALVLSFCLAACGSSSKSESYDAAAPAAEYEYAAAEEAAAAKDSLTQEQ